MEGLLRVAVGCVFSMLAGYGCSSSSSTPSPNIDSGTTDSGGRDAAVGDSHSGDSHAGDSQSSSSGAVTNVACSVVIEGAVESCSFYENVPVGSVAQLDSSCSAAGTVATTCPTTGVVASCKSSPVSGSSVTETEYVYSTMAATDLQVQCSSEHGTFSSTQDGGMVADAGSICSQLSTCCTTGNFSGLGSADEAACTSAVASGKASTCNTELQTLTALGFCGHSHDGGVDAS
jgi:hypothetical protein